MKTLNLRTLLMVVACCFFLTSCDTESISPNEDFLTSVHAENARATVYRNSYELNYDEPEWYRFVTGCNDEQLRLIGGTLRVQSTVIVKDNRVTLQNQANSSGLRVINETTGVEYVGSFGYKQNERYQFHVTEESLDYYPYTYKETLSIVLTTPGGGNNIQVKVDVNFKLDKDGNITVDTENYRINCER